MLGAGEISNFVNTEIDNLLGLYGRYDEAVNNLVRIKLNYLPHILKEVGIITETQENMLRQKIKSKLKKVEDEKLWMVSKL